MWVSNSNYIFVSVNDEVYEKDNNDVQVHIWNNSDIKIALSSYKIHNSSVCIFCRVVWFTPIWRPWRSFFNILQMQKLFKYSAYTLHCTYSIGDAASFLIINQQTANIPRDNDTNSVVFNLYGISIETLLFSFCHLEVRYQRLQSRQNSVTRYMSIQLISVF
jgi:hypothetical protein